MCIHHSTGLMSKLSKEGKGTFCRVKLGLSIKSAPDSGDHISVSLRRKVTVVFKEFETEWWTMNYDIIIIPLNPTWLFEGWCNPQACFFFFLTIFLFIWILIFIAIALIRKNHTGRSFTYVEKLRSFALSSLKFTEIIDGYFLPSYYFPPECLFTQDDRNARCQASINRFTLTLLRSISGGCCCQTEKRCN